MGADKGGRGAAGLLTQTAFPAEPVLLEREESGNSEFKLTPPPRNDRAVASVQIETHIL